VNKVGHLAGGGDVPVKTDRAPTDQSLQPWQFFVLAALACATVVTFIVRGQGITVVILLTILMGTAALVGLAALRAVRPLVTTKEDRTVMIGDRTRAALEREKLLALRSIKELEFDRAMKKISEEDFRELSGRLRARAIRIMRQLDAGTGYRDRIERDLAKRLGEDANAGSKRTRPASDVTGVCANCSTSNDADAKFCKSCGSQL
jgi:hypothetical protein